MKQLMRPALKDVYGILKLQNVILNIMQDIDDLCRKNGIEYYVIGGTALGAVRHGGFIPWDDDLDIAMTRANYNRFIQICRSQLDSTKYFFQEGRKDWPLYFSKVRLLGTYIDELEGDNTIPMEKRGVYVDVFPLDNVPENKLKSYWWYLSGKLLVSYSLYERGYASAPFWKKIILGASSVLRYPPIRHFFEHQVIKYNHISASYIGGFSLISRYHNTITPKGIWGMAKYVQFESIQLMAPENIEGFLSYYFGNYMQLPPEDKRLSKHIIKVDLGAYKTN